MQWLPLAFLSSITAALLAIFAKLGLKDVGPTLATTVRSVSLAARFLGETLRWKPVVGAILMIIGAILVST